MESSPLSLPPIDWVHYHNYTEMVTLLLALNETYSGIVDVFSIGKSVQGRDIYCVRLTNESDPIPKPQVLFTSYHHAREQITLELALYFVVYMATNYGSNATVTELVNKGEIYVVTGINVDGIGLFAANDWQRKNARPIDDDEDGVADEDPPEDEDGDAIIEQLLNLTSPVFPEFIRWEGWDNDGDGENGEDWVGGVDLDRNYAYEWEHGTTSSGAETYRGPAPFSEPETCAIRDLVLQHSFKYAIDFHSGTFLILYPWGCSRNPPPDEAKFIEIAQDLSDATGGTPYMQSSYLYYTYGVEHDWLYAVANVSALACEIYGSDWPGVEHPGPYPNTTWSGGLRYGFNPFPEDIEAAVLRWLPSFFYMTNRAITESYTLFHNLAAKKVEPEKAAVGQGLNLKLNVTVKNEGTFPETLNVTVKANSTKIHDWTLTLAVGESKLLTFQWDTTGFAKGSYTVSAYITPIFNETKTTDNLVVAGPVLITIPGDCVSKFFEVDIFDITAIGVCYDSKLGDSNYYPVCDIDGSGVIDIFDVTTACITYGQKYP
jgi:hypothetical protein